MNRSAATSVSFEAVAIGASAGGIEALSVLLPALQPGFPAAVLAVVHLPPDAGSTLAALFDQRCLLPVREAADKEPLIPGCVYLAPSGYHLLVEMDRRAALSTEAPVNFSRPSLDVMFESAAWVYGKRLLGIVLTGASADGTNGLLAIRAAGGTTWAQSPQTAREPTMPGKAIAGGAVDEVLTLEAMAERFRGMAGRARDLA